MLRVSYTLLRLWHDQRLDEVLSYYTKRETITTDQMIIGQGWDYLVNEQVKKDSCLPKEFGGLKLNIPIVQKKLEAILEDIELVGVPDIIDTGDPMIIYEIKTGVTASNAYISSKQIEMYALLAELVELPITQFRVIRYNPYNEKYDWAMRWNTKDVAMKAREYILEKAPEIKVFLESNGVKI